MALTLEQSIDGTVYRLGHFWVCKSHALKTTAFDKLIKSYIISPSLVFPSRILSFLGQCLIGD